MPGRLDEDELIERWTLVGDELERSRAKRGANGLGFALLWKFFVQHARFPRGRSEFPDEVVAFVARQLRVPASELGLYEWSGRTIERHRSEIRLLLGFRECTVADQDVAVEWLIESVTTAEQRYDQVRMELLGWLCRERVEPPTAGRLDRMVRSALERGERVLVDRVSERLPELPRARLNLLVFGVPDELPAADDVVPAGERDVLAWVKTDPGRLSLNTMLDEIAKLEAIRELGVPGDVLADVAPRIVSGWRVRAAAQSPSHFRGFAAPTRWVLLVALLVERHREITDTLVELLISTVHAINARADRRVTEEMVASFKRVRNKNALLARISEASLNRPRAWLLPVLVIEPRARRASARRGIGSRPTGVMLSGWLGCCASGSCPRCGYPARLRRPRGIWCGPARTPVGWRPHAGSIQLAFDEAFDAVLNVRARRDRLDAGSRATATALMVERLRARCGRWCSRSPAANRHCGRWSRNSKPPARNSDATCRSSCAAPTPITTGRAW